MQTRVYVMYFVSIPLQVLPLKIPPVVRTLHIVNERLTTEKLSNNTACQVTTVIHIVNMYSLPLVSLLSPTFTYSLHSRKIDFLGSDSPSADKPPFTLAASSAVTGLNL